MKSSYSHFFTFNGILCTRSEFCYGFTIIVIHILKYLIYRWTQPQFTNGVIEGYMVQCWFIEDRKRNQTCKDQSIPASILEYTVHNLERNMTYYFQVRAHTKIGPGPYTDVINVTTTYESPVPKLLVATADAVRILDLDQEINYTLTRHSAIDVNYLEVENDIYWISEMQELVTSEISGANVTKILAFNNTAHSLCIDWVARNLYWTEYNTNPIISKDSNNTNPVTTQHQWGPSSSIMKLDLTMWKAGIVKYSNILKISKYIPIIDVLSSLGYVNFYIFVRRK